MERINFFDRVRSLQTALALSSVRMSDTDAVCEVLDEFMSGEEDQVLEIDTKRWAVEYEQPSFDLEWVVRSVALDWFPVSIAVARDSETGLLVVRLEPRK